VTSPIRLDHVVIAVSDAYAIGGQRLNVHGPGTESKTCLG
jgi:hypothetical protein